MNLFIHAFVYAAGYSMFNGHFDTQATDSYPTRWCWVLPFDGRQRQVYRSSEDLHRVLRYLHVDIRTHTHTQLLGHIPTNRRTNISALKHCTLQSAIIDHRVKTAIYQKCANFVRFLSACRSQANCCMLDLLTIRHNNWNANFKYERRFAKQQHYCYHAMWHWTITISLFCYSLCIYMALYPCLQILVARETAGQQYGSVRIQQAEILSSKQYRDIWAWR